MKNLLHVKLFFLLVLTALASATAVTLEPIHAGGTVTTSTIGGPIDYGLE